MTIKEALVWAKKELKTSKVAESEASADFLMRAVLDFSQSELYAKSDQKLSFGQARKFKSYIKKRLKHRPVWQITGSVDFYGRNFIVNTNVLVPRPETELLVQEAVKRIKNLDGRYQNKTSNNKRFKNLNSAIKILDIGTGSGPIIVTLASELTYSSSEQSESRSTLKRFSTSSSNIRFYASDISAKALNIAKKNARLNKVDQSIKFKKSDLFSAWGKEKFDIICANLPYIPHEEMATLALDIMHYEPRLALDGGKGGMEIYAEFLQQLPGHLKQGGIVFCEIGAGQGKIFKELAKKYLPAKKVKVLDDIAKIDRIAIIG